MHKFAAVVLLLSLLLSACGTAAPSVAPGLTGTSAPAGTVPPARTPTPASTPTSTLPPTPVPNPITVDNVDRIAERMRFGEGQANHIAWSPDGQWLAAAGQMGLVVLEAATLEDVIPLEPEGTVNSIAFSPDGLLLAAGVGGLGTEPEIHLWQTSDWTLQRTLKGHTAYVNDLAFSPDGSVLASAGGQDSIKLWRVADGNTLGSFRGSMVAFSSDGGTLALGSGMTISLRRTSDWQAVFDLEINGQPWKVGEPYTPVDSLALSPDGERLLAGVRDGSVRLWRAADGEPIFQLENNVRMTNFSLDGSYFSFHTVAFSNAGDVFAAGNESGVLRVWRAPDGDLVDTFNSRAGGVKSLAFSPDDAEIAVLTVDGVIKVWSIPDGKVVRERTGFFHAVTNVTLSSDGSLVAVVTTDGKVRLWRMADAQLERALPVDASRAVFSPDGGLLATVSDNGTARLWRVADGEELAVMNHDQRGWMAHVYGADFSPDGSILFTGADDGLAYTWQTSNGALLYTLGEPDVPAERTINALDLSPDGSVLALGFGEGSVRLWNVADRTLGRTLRTDHVYRLSFSPDGAQLATVSFDGRVRVWETASGEVVQTLAGGQFMDAAFSPDGRLLAAGAWGRFLRVWDLSTGEALTDLADRAPVYSVGFSQDGSWIVTGALDGAARLWGVP